MCRPRRCLAIAVTGTNRGDDTPDDCCQGGWDTMRPNLGFVRLGLGLSIWLNAASLVVNRYWWASPVRRCISLSSKR
jgi:hypothetical protein